MNCLSTVIPTEICNATNLDALFMAGLRGSEKCGEKNYNYDSFFYVKMPSCLWTISTIKTMYLSGNAFSGAIDLNEFDVVSSYLVITIISFFFSLFCCILVFVINGTFQSKCNFICKP